MNANNICLNVVDHLPETILMNTHNRCFLWRNLEKHASIIIKFRWFKKGSCQLLEKECALSTGKYQEHCG